MAQLVEYKCPCCGGNIKFDSDTQKVVCPFCDSTFDMESIKEYEQKINSSEQEAVNWNDSEGEQWQEAQEGGMAVYICSSCGGEVVGDETTAATNCPYCGNAIVISNKLSGMLKPDLIIPFKLDKKTAKEAFKKHLEKKRLLPKVFKTENHIDEIKGIYVPFWLFDCDSNGNMYYKGEKIRTWSDSEYNYTEHSYYGITRIGKLGFNKIPVDGSQNMDDALMDSIEPFDYSGLEKFDTPYLAGYFAQKYDVGKEESQKRAFERIDTTTRNAFRNTVHGYASVSLERGNITLTDSKTHYALFPVWLFNTTWKGKKYTFAMNGQTGKFVGNLPMDKGAFWRWFLGIFGITGIVLTVISMLII